MTIDKGGLEHRAITWYLPVAGLLLDQSERRLCGKNNLTGAGTLGGGYSQSNTTLQGKELSEQFT